MCTQAEWALGGAVTLDIGGKLAFPSVHPQPGAYEFRWSQDGHAFAYVGESDNLQRRMAHYRNPGPSQRTNVRLREILHGHLAAGGSVQLATAAVAAASHESDLVPLDLADRYARRLVESARVLELRRAGVTLLNA